MTEGTPGTRVRVGRIGNETHYVAEVPSRLMGGHSSLHSDRDGRIWGQMGSERTMPAAIDGLPAWSQERSEAVRRWQHDRYDAAYRAIVRRHPQAGDGRRAMGTIVVADKPR